MELQIDFTLFRNEMVARSVFHRHILFRSSDIFFFTFLPLSFFLLLSRYVYIVQFVEQERYKIDSSRFLFMQRCCCCVVYVMLRDKERKGIEGMVGEE